MMHFCRSEVRCENTLKECVNEIGAYSCRCKDGFTLDTSNQQCEDVDECVLQSCPDLEMTCENEVGSFACTCPNGYETDDTNMMCVDQNECDVPNVCDGLCLNTDGSFSCG